MSSKSRGQPCLPVFTKHKASNPIRPQTEAVRRSGGVSLVPYLPTASYKAASHYRGGPGNYVRLDRKDSQKIKVSRNHLLSGRYFLKGGEQHDKGYSGKEKGKSIVLHFQYNRNQCNVLTKALRSKQA